MDQQQGEGVVRDAAAKVGDTVSDLAAKTGETVQGKIDQAKPVLKDGRETAGAASEKPADCARRVSTAGSQAVDGVQGAAGAVGNRASQAANTVYEQGA